MINNELLIDGNIVTAEQMAQILSPLTAEQTEKYAKDLCLAGLNKDITDYLNKLNAFVATGNTESFNPNCEVVTENKTVTLYRKQVTDVDGKLVYVNCSPEDTNAESYEYTYKVNKVKTIKGNPLALQAFFEKSQDYKEQMEKSFYCFLDNIENQNLKGLYYADINDFFENLYTLREIFLLNPFLTNNVIIELLNDIIANIEEIKNQNEIYYNEKKYFDNQTMTEKLAYLKQMYIAYYNAYEQACNMGFSGYKTTKGYELDT